MPDARRSSTSVWSTARQLEENLLECEQLAKIEPDSRERAFRSIRTFAAARALQRGASLALAREEGMQLEAVSRDLVHMLDLIASWNHGGRGPMAEPD